MKVSAQIFSVLFASVALSTPLPGMAAQRGAKPPAAVRYYAFVGHWRGKGQLSEIGHAPVALALWLSCSKAASGWAVRCELLAKNGKMRMTESDLFGVDAVTGQGHWYAVTNQGDAHDHLTHWIDAKTMSASHAWTQDGKHFEEHITITLPHNKTLTFRSVVTANGVQVNAFSGKVSR